jgi:hypothetical protein
MKPTLQIYELVSPLKDDFDQLAKALPSRYDWIWLHDLTEDVKAAKENLVTKGLLKGV